MRLSVRLCAMLAVLMFQSGVYAQRGVTVRWYGHAVFAVTSSKGVVIALDPYGDIGYPTPNLKADVVTVSHGHGDHNNAALVRGRPKIIRGLAMGGRHWAWVNFRLKDVRVKSFPAYHDKSEGKEQGLNTIFLVEVSGIRIVHMSDIGHIPPELTLKSLERVDVLLIPVGGLYSIDASEASRIVDRLKPAVVIPIHYKTKATASWPIATEEAFVKDKPRVKQVGSTISLRREGLPKATEIWVMGYR